MRESFAEWEVTKAQIDEEEGVNNRLDERRTRHKMDIQEKLAFTKEIRMHRYLESLCSMSGGVARNRIQVRILLPQSRGSKT